MCGLWNLKIYYGAYNGFTVTSIQNYVLCFLAWTRAALFHFNNILTSKGTFLLERLLRSSLSDYRGALLVWFLMEPF